MSDESVRARGSADADDVVIVGAGPAGLTAAYQLNKLGKQPVVLESDSVVGGISRTVERDVLTLTHQLAQRSLVKVVHRPDLRAHESRARAADQMLATRRMLGDEPRT